MFKRCIACEQERPAYEYYDGSNKCRPCHNEVQRDIIKKRKYKAIEESVILRQALAEPIHTQEDYISQLFFKARLAPFNKKTRSCIKCKARFESKSFGNRICPRCNSNNSKLSARASEPSLDYNP